MSGRKSTEVAAVLKQGESVRRLTDDVYSREIQRCYAQYLESLNGERKIQSSAAVEVALETEAQEMFGAEGNALVGEFRTLKQNLQRQTVTDNGKAVLEGLERLDSKLKAADDEADSIRQAIRNKNWYCDDEYRRAQNLVATYGKLRDERVKLERQMKNLLTAENQKLSAMRESSTRLENLVQQLENMNATAKKRKAADSFRAELQSALESVDAKNAEKFFAADFADLRKNISAAVALSDDGILAAFQKNYAAVAEFKTKLADRIALWHKQKSDAENLFAQMEHAAAETLIGPVDYYNDGENGRRVNLFEYLKTYGGQDFSAQFAKLRSEAQSLIRQENFTGSMPKIQAAIELAENARQEGLKLQESMLKKTELAGAIQNVMEDMRYDVDLQIINDNPRDGFKITCRVGDEIIDFQRVDIDGDGKIVIDVDHREGKGGNCANSWKDISQRLNAEGIPVTDVRTARGSVLHHETAAEKVPGDRVRAR